MDKENWISLHIQIESRISENLDSQLRRPSWPLFRTLMGDRKWRNSSDNKRYRDSPELNPSFCAYGTSYNHVLCQFNVCASFFRYQQKYLLFTKNYAILAHKSATARLKCFVCAGHPQAFEPLASSLKGEGDTLSIAAIQLLQGPLRVEIQARDVSHADHPVLRHRRH